MHFTTRRIQELGSVFIDFSRICTLVLPSLTNYRHIMHLVSHTECLQAEKGMRIPILPRIVRQ